MKWINTKDGIIRVDEEDDGLFKMWFHDAFAFFVPKILKKIVSKEHEQQSLEAFDKKIKKKYVFKDDVVAYKKWRKMWDRRMLIMGAVCLGIIVLGMWAR